MGIFSQQLEDIEPALRPEPEVISLDVDYSKVGKTADDVRDKMIHGFKFGKEGKGKTTHCDPIDKLFTWKPGFLYCFTGYPQAGKSQATLFLAVLKSKFSGWKWVVYTPESGKPEEYFDELVHCYIGKSTDPYFHNVMSEEEYLAGIDFVSQHFIFLDDDEFEAQGITATPEVLRKTFEHYHSTWGANGFIKDPWNALAGGEDIRDDKYLKRELTAEKRLALRLNIVNIILAHPKESIGPYNPEKGLDPPRPRDLAGGAMWNNRCDVIGVWHRPNFHKNPKDTNVTLITRKVKQQQLVGSLGELEMNFNPREYRYYVYGSCPLVKPGIQEPFAAAVQATLHPNPGHNLPESDFEKNLNTPVNDREF